MCTAMLKLIFWCLMSGTPGLLKMLNDRHSQQPITAHIMQPPSQFWSWHICITIVIIEMQQYPAFIVVGTDVVINNKSVAKECNKRFSLHCCQATNYFVLLLIIIHIKYYECVSVFLP